MKIKLTFDVDSSIAPAVAKAVLAIMETGKAEECNNAPHEGKIVCLHCRWEGYAVELIVGKGFSMHCPSCKEIVTGGQ